MPEKEHIYRPSSINIVRLIFNSKILQYDKLSLSAINVMNFKISFDASGMDVPFTSTLLFRETSRKIRNSSIIVEREKM